MPEQQRTYTLEEAAAELHLNEETIKQTLETLNIDLNARSGRKLTEDEVNQVMDSLVSPQDGKG